jgi:hypothetical protein
MPTPRKYATNAARQAAYRARGATAPSSTGPRAPALPGARRWTALLHEARKLVEEVADEMATQAAARADAWYDSACGEQFTERLEMVDEALDLLRTVSEA